MKITTKKQDEVKALIAGFERSHNCSFMGVDWRIVEHRTINDSCDHEFILERFVHPLSF